MNNRERDLMWKDIMERYIDWVCGNVVFLRHDGEGGTIGLTDDDLNFLEKKFNDDACLFTKFGIIQALEY